MALNSCIACSGELEPQAHELDTVSVATCSTCDGLHVEAESLEDVTDLVAVRGPMLADAPAESLRYFDVTWVEPGFGPRRCHGWMERASRRVVQFG